MEEHRHAIVELMGHRKFGARITEVEQFGVKLLRAEILTAGDPVVQLVHPQALYALTTCSEAQARACNTAWTLQQAAPGVAALPAPARELCPDCPEGDRRVADRTCEECGARMCDEHTQVQTSDDDETIDMCQRCDPPTGDGPPDGDGEQQTAAA